GGPWGGAARSGGRVGGARTNAARGRRGRRPRWSSGAAAVVLPSGELEILPRHALVLFAGVAQEEGRVEGRDQDRRAVGVHATPQLADRLARAEEALGRDAAGRQDDLGLE